MKCAYRCSLLIFGTVLSALPIFPGNGVGHIVFRVVDEFGKSVPYKLEGFVSSAGRDFKGSFTRLEASDLPFGTYAYTLGRADVVTDLGKITGRVDLLLPEQYVTLTADPALMIGADGAFAVDRAIPTDFVLRGQIRPVPMGESPVWVRLQAAFGSTVAEARVTSSGEFRIYRYLVGAFTLSVVREGEFLHVEPVVFPGDLKPQLLSIRLEQPPRLRTVR